MNLPSASACAIIGGGALGLSSAYHLARAGMKEIVLLEKGLLGEGSTGACLGGIRLDFSTEINIRFSLAAMPRWERFAGEFGVDPGFRQTGYLMLAGDEMNRHILQEGRALQARLGVRTDWLAPEELKKRWPHLRVDDLTGGTFCAADGHLGPQEVIAGYARSCRALGVRIFQETEVTGLRFEGERLRGVETARGAIETPLAVCCAGPWAGAIGRMAGVEIPVRPIRRQVFLTGPVPALPPEMPLTIDLAQHTTYKPEGEGFILYGPQDVEPGFRTTVDWDAAAWAVERAVRRIPAFAGADIVRGWAGLYELTPDSHGIMGAVPGREGLYLAAGFSGHGFQHSPVIGQAMAELILDGAAKILDISPLSLDRFARGDMIPEKLTAHHAEAG
ncbi:MAG: FAD-dependent oxidoreductase [bacterium]|nr:FAD-dependent oxidoreductase [bacterium]